MSEAPPSSFWEPPLAERRDLAEETVAVAAACASGIFRALAEEGPAEAAGLAERLGLDVRATGIMTAFLTDLGLLERRDAGYAPTDRARRVLADPSADEYAAAGLPLWLSNLEAFATLPRVLEEGEPVNRERPKGEGNEGIREGDAERERIARFMAAMNAAPRDRVRRVVDLSLERASDPRRVLDLGGGPGHMSKEFARRGLETVLFDQPATVRFVASEYGLADIENIRLVGGDFNRDPLPEGPFDVVLLSNVLHIYGPETNRELLHDVARVTAPGGVCAVAEFVRGVSPRAARFALVMLLKTENGNTYTEDQYMAWLAEAGFDEARLEMLDPDRQLLTAVRT